MNQSTWSFLLTGMILGLVIGVFGCFLFYLSGRVPPLPQAADAIPIVEPEAEAAELTAEVDAEIQSAEPRPDANPGLQLDFYQELPNYEVAVDASPVEITQTQAVVEPAPTPSLTIQPPSQTRYMLQSGAFQQRESAQYQKSRLETLGMTTIIKEQSLPGRTLYLVQSGPYLDRAQVSQAEQTMRDNSITSMRISLN